MAHIEEKQVDYQLKELPYTRAIYTLGILSLSFVSTGLVLEWLMNLLAVVMAIIIYIFAGGIAALANLVFIFSAAIGCILSIVAFVLYWGEALPSYEANPSIYTDTSYHKITIGRICAIIGFFIFIIKVFMYILS